MIAATRVGNAAAGAAHGALAAVGAEEEETPSPATPTGSCSSLRSPSAPPAEDSQGSPEPKPRGGLTRRLSSGHLGFRSSKKGSGKLRAGGHGIAADFASPEPSSSRWAESSAASNSASDARRRAHRLLVRQATHNLPADTFGEVTHVVVYLNEATFSIEHDPVQPRLSLATPRHSNAYSHANATPKRPGELTRLSKLCPDPERADRAVCRRAARRALARPPNRAAARAALGMRCLRV